MMNNKNYKKSAYTYIGGSDVAALTLTGYKAGSGVVSQILGFGIDGGYFAYVIDETYAIPSHYELVATFDSWVKIYDDVSLVRVFKGQKINIYRAGKAGCIIQVVK